MRRVLSVVHSPSFGGPHNEALRLAEPMRRRGFETVVAIPDEAGTAAPRLRAAGVEVEQLPLGRLRASPNPRLLYRFVRDFQPSVRALEAAIDRTGATVVQIGGLVNPHAAFAARRCGAAVVWQILDARAPAPVRRLVLPVVRRRAHVVMFNGEAILAVHGGRNGFRMPTFVYYPPVDTQRFVPSSERRLRVREELGIPADAPVVGTVANLVPVKRIEIFVDAAARIAASNPEARFIVIGSAPESHAGYASRLRRQAQELDLAHPIVFAGERADVEYWYAALDLHLITSRSEATTTTALEAASCGVPVVAIDVGAVHEVVEHGVTGMLLDSDRAEAVAAAVMALLRDPVGREEMGRAGRAAAFDRAGVETVADFRARAYEAALERVVAGESEA